MTAAAASVIVVGTDFSPAADAALEATCRDAATRDASIVLLHVNESWHNVEDDEVLVREIDPPTWRRIKRELAIRARRVTDLGLDCRTELLEGSPWSQIVEYARRIGAQRIVIGARRKNSGRRTFFTHVAEHVVRHAPCTVEVIPHDA